MTLHRLAVVALASVSGLAMSASAEDAPAASTSVAMSQQEIAAAATNPNVPITQIVLRDVIAPSLPGYYGTGNTLQLQAEVPLLPSKIIPFPIIMKLQVALTTLPEPVGQTALGNTGFFVQAVFPEKGFSWGFGLTFVFPTQTYTGPGVPPGTWQLGPAAAFIYSGIPNLVVGGVFQNPITLGSSQNPSNALSFTPSITYNLPEGWFVGYADFNWSVNWEANAAVTFPVGMQAGKVFTILGQPFVGSLEGGYAVVRPYGSTTPRWLIGIEFIAIFPAI